LWLLAGASSLFFPPCSFADTVVLKNGKELKGLVVEQHADRILLSTETGEIPILLKGIKDIKFDDPEQNFYQIGKAYEATKDYARALAYYDKALEVNPSFAEARKAMVAVQNRFWALQTEGPRHEIERQEAIYGTPSPAGDEIQTKRQKESGRLREGLGMALEKSGDWVMVAYVEPKKDAYVAGLRVNDRLVAVDGESLRYLGREVVTRKFIEPKYTAMTLELDREIYLKKDQGRKTARDLGLGLHMEYAGLKVSGVRAESAAAMSGLRKGDLVIGINGAQTRYMPLKKVLQAIEANQEGGRVVLTVRRSTLMTRK